MTPQSQHSQTPPQTRPATQTTHVGGLDTAVVTRKSLAEIMVHDCLLRRNTPALPKVVFSSNGQGVALAGFDENFSRTMRAADIIHADGMSVVWASRLLTSKPLPERVATTDFFHDAARAAVENGLSFFILGADENLNREAVIHIQAMYPGLKIVGRRNGYFKREEEPAICQQIVQSGADVLWVALGKPLQEEFCLRNRQNLNGVGWIKTCGGLYAFLTGKSRRAPQFVQDYGMEWIWRLGEDPLRLAKRYILTNPYAIYRMIRYSRSS